jgi:predicted nucleic acid-binding protein
LIKVALDTNFLAYAEGVDDAARRDKALDILDRLPADWTVLPVQVLGELYNVLTRKGGQSGVQARERLTWWSTTFPLTDTTASAMKIAADLAADHHFKIWDAVILGTASVAGCRLLLSEDMQDGFGWGGVTIVNPFAADRHPLLAIALAGK